MTQWTRKGGQCVCLKKTHQALWYAPFSLHPFISGHVVKIIITVEYPKIWLCIIMQFTPLYGPAQCKDEGKTLSSFCCCCHQFVRNSTHLVVSPVRTLHREVHKQGSEAMQMSPNEERDGRVGRCVYIWYMMHGSEPSWQSYHVWCINKDITLSICCLLHHIFSTQLKCGN